MLSSGDCYQWCEHGLSAHKNYYEILTNVSLDQAID